LADHAHLFSRTAQGAFLLYNHQIAQLQKNASRLENVAEKFHEWRLNIPLQRIRNWDIDRFWSLAVDGKHNITLTLRMFFEAWLDLVRTKANSLLQDQAAIELVRNRETFLKGSRSRFENERAREKWDGHSGSVDYSYRWTAVQGLLNDLFMGLEKT
jgi:hypothetical protein